jgi:putative tryptophan/tyrosine transport system substrate-binding protein
VRRRDFISFIGGAFTVWPFVARAQQPGRLQTVGALIPGARAVYGQRVAATVQRLRELGWVEGRNLAIEYRWVEAQAFDDIAAEFVRLKVDVIFTSGGTPPALAAKKASSSIPIVFVSTGDPVGSGLVASLARPGGNITGVSNQTVDLASKRVGLFRELVPDLRRLAIMANTRNVSATSEMREVQVAASTLGIQPVLLEVQGAADIAPAFSELRQRADALYVVIDHLVSTQASRINTLAMDANPACASGRCRRSVLHVSSHRTCAARPDLGHRRCALCAPRQLPPSRPQLACDG